MGSLEQTAPEKERQEREESSPEQTEHNVKLFEDLHESQGHNLALAVLCVPFSLDRGPD